MTQGLVRAIRRRAPAARWLAPGLLLASGCGSKGAVAIVATIEAPSASVAISSLERRLTGGFVLHLELGQYAPSGTDVSVQTFSLVRSSDQGSLVVLKIAAVPAPPYHLEPGAMLAPTMAIADQPGTPGQIITQADLGAICQAGIVEIAGSITDSASDQPTPLHSLSFAIAGCP